MVGSSNRADSCVGAVPAAGGAFVFFVYCDVSKPRFGASSGAILELARSRK